MTKSPVDHQKKLGNVNINYEMEHFTVSDTATMLEFKVQPHHSHDIYIARLMWAKHGLVAQSNKHACINIYSQFNTNALVHVEPRHGDTY